MAVARTPRGKWIEEGLRALAAGGPDAVRVESLAKALGVTKGGFYWYFTDRQALLDEMLDTWEHELVDEVIDRVERQGGDTRERLHHLYALAATGHGLRATIETDLAIRDWARRDPTVAQRLRRVDNRRMDYLRSLYGEFCADSADVEARSMLAFALWIGNHFIAADHGGRSRSEALELAIKWLES